MQRILTRADFQNLSGPTGIFGGTFDPIQNAHLTIARRAVNHLKLDQLIFVPAFVNPLKNKSETLPRQRLKMIELAIDEISCFFTSDIEIETSEPSYTWNTIDFIKRQTDVPLYFICGADCLTSLHKWYKIHELLQAVPFCVAARDRELTDEAFLPLQEHFSLSELTNLKAHLIPGEPVPGSSTIVRGLLHEGKFAGEFIPESVQKYIDEKGLYH